MRAILAALVLIAWPVHAGEVALGPAGQEQLVAHNLLEPKSTWSGATYDQTRCLQVNFDQTTSWDDIVACNSLNSTLWAAKGGWLTGIRVLIASNQVAATGSCEFHLTTNDGVDEIAGSILDVGAGSGSPLQIGTVYEARFNHRLEAGSAFQIEVRNGSQCEAGTGCLCQNLGKQQFSIWGRFQ